MSETPETGWPGGWYIYENGKVDGPYAATEAFSRAAETSDGKPRLVSRKGFSQWYALKDLSEIFRMTEQLGLRASREQQVLAAQLARFKAAASAPNPEKAAASRPADQSAGVEAVSTPPQRAPAPLSIMMDRPAEVSPAEFFEAPTTTMPESAVEPATVATPEMAEPEAAEPTPSPRPRPALPPRSQPRVQAKAIGPSQEPRALPATKPSRRLDEPEHKASPAPVPLKAKHRAKAKAAKVAVHAASKAMQATMQEYFLQQNRLRLGRIRNPWVTAFVGAPLTLLAYWVVWVAAMNREIQWHAKNEHAKSMGLAILAAIPGLHVVAVYQLAKAIRAMEDQNRYATVTPTVACLFGIFPPFAMAYLQDAANRHWLLHARYSQARTAARSEPGV